MVSAPLSDILMIYIKYLTHACWCNKEVIVWLCVCAHMPAGAIRQLLYGCAYVREINHSLKLVYYPTVPTHKPYNNLHIYAK